MKLKTRIWLIIAGTCLTIIANQPVFLDHLTYERDATLSKNLTTSMQEFCAKHRSDPTYPGCRVQGPAQRPIEALPIAVPQPIGVDHQRWMIQAGIPPAEQTDANFIITNESGWQVTVSNYQGSGAYGLCQALPGSKIASEGPDWRTNPITQLRWCNKNAHSGRYTGWASVKAWWLRTDCRPPGANPCYPGHWW